MPLLLGFLCLIFLLLFALVARFFTVDVLFHEVLPNDGAAAIIAAVSGVLLIGVAVAIAKSGKTGIKAVGLFLAGAIVLLLLQPILQGLGRSYTRASLEADWEELRDGLKLSNFADEPLATEAGQPIGLRLSFDLTLERTASLQFFPSAQSKSAPPHFLEAARFERDPAPGANESKSRFEAKRTYRLAYDLMPSILAWDRDRESFCLMYPGTQEFMRMAQSDAVPSQMTVKLDAALFHGSHQSFRFEADSHAIYDIGAIGRSGLEEDFPSCGSNLAKHLLYEE